MSESSPQDRVYRFGDFLLVAEGPMLLREGNRLPVTPRVLNVLRVLVENAGRIVAKETLMAEVWADSFVEEGNLNRTISRLRKILGESPNENRFVETIPRVGYRFIADVELVQERSQYSTKLKAEEVQRPENKRGRTWLAFSLVSALMAIAVASIWLLWPGREGANNTKPPKQTPFRLTYNPTREERPVFTSDSRIRFIRWLGNTPVSFVMNSDGTDPHRDVSIAGLRTGSWSPDGKKVVFYKDGGDPAVYLADADGSNETKLPFTAGNLDWSPDGSKVIYQSGKVNSEIYLYVLATGAISEIVTNPSFESDASFSPDGKSMVFVSDRDGNAEIYSRDLDGTAIRRLTNHPAHDEFPTFSPDGTQIVFNSNREDENFDIYLMNADGTGVRRLTNWKSEEEIRPGCWSADGTQIVFTSSKDGKSNVYVMEVEPFFPSLVLSDDAGNFSSPTYSPDGNSMMYVSEADDKSGELHVVDLKSKYDRVLLKAESAEMFPRFSPDGRSIVFQNRIDGNAEICLISVEAGDIRNLTANPARDVNPSWSPDSSKIVFASNREGNYDVFSLWTMNVDGSNQHPIYYSYAISTDPSWSPD